MEPGSSPPPAHGAAHASAPGPAHTADLDRLLRWEGSGGGWRAAAVGTEDLTLTLVTCDGGEEMGTLTSSAPDVREHVAGRSRHP